MGKQEYEDIFNFELKRVSAMIPEIKEVGQVDDTFENYKSNRRATYNMILRVDESDANSEYEFVVSASNTPANMQDAKSAWPNVKFLSEDRIVADFMSKLSIEDKEYISSFEEHLLPLFNHTIGRTIRNSYHLWHPKNLYTDCSDSADNDHHPDNMSMRIVYRIYHMLHV